MDSNDSNVTLTGFPCSKCSKQIKRKNNLVRHEQNCIARDENIKNGVTCPDCKQVFGRLGFLRIHVQDVHKVPQEVEEKSFQTMNEFEEWKTKIEKENLCFYFKKRRFTDKGQIRTYLYCHRSGFFKTESKGVRRWRKETNKIDATCISTMVVTENAKGIGVVFHKTHFGHDIDLDKCYLTPEERAMIAGTPEPDNTEENCSAKSDDNSNDHSSQTITCSTDVCEDGFMSSDSFPNNLHLICYAPEIDVTNENMGQSDSELIIYHDPSDYEKKKQDIARKIDVAKDTFMKNKYTPEELNSVFKAVDNVLELMMKRKRKFEIVEENEPVNKLMKNQSLSSKTKVSKKSSRQSLVKRKKK